MLAAAFELFFLLQGCALLGALSLAWLWAASRRRTALSEWRARSDAPAPRGPRPWVTAVLPVTGASPRRLRNWRSQLASDYDGPLHAVFAAATEADPAYAAASQLCLEVSPSAVRSARVVVAGRASRTSQKVHSQVAGVACADPRTALLLFLDDDVRLHPGTVDALVDALLQRPGALLARERRRSERCRNRPLWRSHASRSPQATGYPFDVPSGPRPSLWSLVSMAHHLPLLVAFSQGAVAPLGSVWGGCMLLRASALAPPSSPAPGCVASAWGDGAYSDDLNVAALARGLGRAVACPGVAAFPAEAPPHVGPAHAWNFLRRQVYVLDTYADAHNRRVNHAMLFALVYCAAALLAALAATAHRGWLALLCAPLRPCARDAAAVAVVVVGWAAVRCARRMHASLVALSAALSPRWAPPCEPPWALVAAAFVVAQALLLAAAARTLACSTVLWAGTEYTRKGGRVVRVTQAPSPGHDTHGTR